MEGHPDNVAPAIFGNLCCATGLKDKVLNTVIPVPESLHFAVVVPEVLVSHRICTICITKSCAF